MTFALFDFPDASQQCAMCRRDNCSEQGEKWIHLTTIETDGGYTPAIGMKCLREMAENVGLPAVIVRTETEQVTRDPTSDEVIAHIRENFNLVEANPVDLIANNARSAAHRPRGNARQRKDPASQGTQGTV